jgi:DNA adenine methylase
MKSIFRYPGGKKRALKFITPFWLKVSHDEYREPFVGGGSVYFSKENVKYNWINDKDEELMSFYKIIKNPESRELLINELIHLKVSKEQYTKFFFQKTNNDFEKAKRFYFLNRCSFSGMTRWNAYIGDSRYNIINTQEFIRDVGKKLEKTKITNKDFEKVITQKSDNSVFMFIDPPYFQSRQIATYNEIFSENDHIRLAKLLKETKFKFLLTYDNCKFIKEIYSWCNFYERNWSYSLANSKVHSNKRRHGKELFISNFKLN